MIRHNWEPFVIKQTCFGEFLHSHLSERQQNFGKSIVILQSKKIFLNLFQTGRGTYVDLLYWNSRSVCVKIKGRRGRTSSSSCMRDRAFAKRRQCASEKVCGRCADTASSSFLFFFGFVLQVLLQLFLTYYIPFESAQAGESSDHVVFTIDLSW